MSDFDKEAEREKLRKKFARDDEKRAETQRMSELLLQGATMTNKHCKQCSDPLFRYNGQTFCPSCQANIDAQRDSRTDADQPTANTQTQPQTDAESTQPQPSADHNPTADPRETSETQSTADQPTHNQSTATQSTASSVDQPAVGNTSPANQPPAAVDEGLTAARQSLERTLTRFARRAEETEDPRRARELLAAAREAAATLSELE